MSREYPCVYYDNQKCKKFEELGYTSWCVMGSCSHETPSNADRNRAMSDEEQAELLLSADQGNFTVDICSEEFCVTEEKDCPHDCTSAALKWLQRPVKDGDNDGN